MNERGREILKATSEAANVLSKFNIGERTSFDIIGAVTELDIPVMFRPLKGLWGAAVSAGSYKGVLVTTILDLPVQRFTLAHELGHVLLGHQMSLDETVGFSGRYGPASRPTEEIAADTFASELLASKPLMVAAAKRHQWTRERLRDPQNVYQLSLRLGISFQATCWALANRNVLTQAEAKALQDQKLKDTKISLAPEALISNPWANVWRLTASDSNSSIEAGPDDLFAICLNDNASAGFLWQMVDVGPDAVVLQEQSSPGVAFGQNTERVLYLRFSRPGNHRLTFEHRRPWNKQSIEHIDISIDSYGKEQGGFARRYRLKALSSGAA